MMFAFMAQAMAQIQFLHQDTGRVEVVFETTKDTLVVASNEYGVGVALRNGADFVVLAPWMTQFLVGDDTVSFFVSFPRQGFVRTSPVKIPTVDSLRQVANQVLEGGELVSLSLSSLYKVFGSYMP